MGMIYFRLFRIFAHLSGNNQFCKEAMHARQHRNHLLRRLTLHRSRRRSGGGTAQGVRTGDRGSIVGTLRWRQIRGFGQRDAGLLQVRNQTTRRTGGSVGFGEKADG